MRKCLLVPETVGVEDENFYSLHIAENYVLVEHVDSPKKFARNNISINFLEVLNIYGDSSNASEKVSLMEHDLLSVR